MKSTLRMLAACFAVLASYNMASADLIWSEDFSSYADGASVDTLATSVGTGTFDTDGSVFVNDTNQLVLTADGGRDTLRVDSAGVDCGYFSFDLQQIAVPDPATSNSVFVQMTEGGRSTGANPIPGFSNTINGAQYAAVETVQYYFNTTATDFTYVAPDGSTDTAAAGSYDYWRGTTRVVNNSSNTTNDTAVPTEVGTFLFNTFNGQAGNVYAFDNMSLNSVVHAVPEPSSGLVLVGFSLLTLSRRRNR